MLDAYVRSQAQLFSLNAVFQQNEAFHISHAVRSL